jgi:hypothetical protein
MTNMQRYLAHKVVIFGIEHSLSIVSIDNNDIATIEPFIQETASTAFVDGTIYVVPINASPTNDIATLLRQSKTLTPTTRAKVIVIQ